MTRSQNATKEQFANYGQITAKYCQFGHEVAAEETFVLCLYYKLVDISCLYGSGVA